MKRYHFSLGNSTRGPVGYCALVRARNKAEAIKTLQRSLPDWHEVRTDEADLVYLTVYFNPGALKPHQAPVWDEDEPDEGDHEGGELLTDLAQPAAESAG